MPNEPGLTLGRLVAAERNALAAIEAVKNMREATKDYTSRIQRLETENLELKRELNVLRAMMYGNRGGGPTSTG